MASSAVRSCCLAGSSTWLGHCVAQNYQAHHLLLTRQGDAGLMAKKR